MKWLHWHSLNIYAEIRKAHFYVQPSQAEVSIVMTACDKFARLSADLLIIIGVDVWPHFQAMGTPKQGKWG